MEETLTPSPLGSLRTLSPLSSASEIRDLSDHGSNSDAGSSILSELSEDLDDIPVFETEHTLLNWLEVGKEKVKKLMKNMKPETKSGWGPYFKSKIGATPADRTVRHRKAEDKRKAAGHGEGLFGWFQRSSMANGAQQAAASGNRTIEMMAQSLTPPVPPLDALSSEGPSQRHPVTMEESKKKKD
ncbi:hypothetical protein C8R44DRAFT_754655 [Mycena epipterygia]|nr:hypothetical protein C8R44DRAFT_754655 [Mycena epipterygia]